MVTIKNAILVIRRSSEESGISGNSKHESVIDTFCNTIFTIKFTNISFAISTHINWY